jgi:hypothetical protein
MGLLVGIPVVVYVLLLIPSPYPSVSGIAGKQPFLWNQDELWSALERQFTHAREESCAWLNPMVDSSIHYSHHLLNTITADSIAPDDQRLDSLEAALFHVAPMVAACPEQLEDYLDLYSWMRRVVKAQSRHWEMATPAARETIYRLLYGGRAAVEEVMLQAPVEDVPSLTPGRAEPSATPSATLLQMTVHSGDILLSRGGAPTSALIARGNDFPGNFSHVALAYVDERTGQLSFIESHIEQGVTISSVDEYLHDEKLRIMVLRLRSDLPELIADPLLPHRAARRARDDAQARHIPYDFAMDFTDHTRLFCSEVASAPYEELGIRLWMGISHISSPGLRSWLAGFGVRHFITQEPSDLEYDPQLCVITEWRDRRLLYKDHLDNAVIDVMLETADSLPRLGYAWYMLPVARLSKMYSLVCNVLGRIGPVPEGMDATAALRNVAFSARHTRIKARLLRRASEFRQAHKYTPPYWVLVELARRARDTMRE